MKFNVVLACLILTACGSEPNHQRANVLQFSSANNLEGKYQLIKRSCSATYDDIVEGEPIGELQISEDISKFDLEMDECTYQLEYQIESLDAKKAHVRFLSQTRSGRCNKLIAEEDLEISYTREKRVFRMNILDKGCYVFLKDK